MVYRSRGGLGDKAACVRAFDALRPYAARLAGLSAGLPMGGCDWMALRIAWDGLQTTAYHFTRRRDYYDAVLQDVAEAPGAGAAFADRAAAIAAFQGLQPFVAEIRTLMERCPPYGRDWLALMIAIESLETAAMHFTGIAAFYGALAQSAAP